MANCVAANGILWLSAITLRLAMPTGVIIALIVIALVGGTVFTLRSTARTGIPSKDVLERAARRSQELDARERADHERATREPVDRGPTS